MQSKLRVYLAPFLYGTRYTSFGRHFTKVEKLQAVSELLCSLGIENKSLWIGGITMLLLCVCVCVFLF